MVPWSDTFSTPDAGFKIKDAKNKEHITMEFKACMHYLFNIYIFVSCYLQLGFSYIRFITCKCLITQYCRKISEGFDKKSSQEIFYVSEEIFDSINKINQLHVKYCYFHALTGNDYIL